MAYFRAVQGTPLDRLLALRTLALASVGCVVAAVVVKLAEPSNLPGAPAAIGLLPLMPMVGAIAATIVVASARRAGELRALAALGAHPSRARAASVLVAATLSLLPAGLLAIGRDDLGAFFPARGSADWQLEGAHGAHSVSRGLALDERGTLIAEPALPDRSTMLTEQPPAHARGSVASLVAMLGLAWPAWLTSVSGRALSRAAIEATALLAFTLILVSAVSVGALAPPWLLAVGVAWLLAAVRASFGTDAPPTLR